jgi:TPR repeat protein
LDTAPPQEQAFQREASISGPSFLGIGTEPDRRSSTYSYLLDEEPRSHKGLWITLVLLAVIGLIALQFRTEVRARGQQLYAAVLARAYPQPVAPASSPSSAPADAAAISSQPATPPAAADAQSVPPSAPDAQSQTAASAASEQKSGDSTTKAATPDSKSNTAKSSKSNAELSKSAESENSGEDAEEATPPKAVHQPRKAALAKPQKPAREETSQDSHFLVMAQKYLRGEGVRRDCEQGLVYLRQALRQPSAAAATQMGALYATGTCVPFDRVQAYRWFGSALQISPRNQWLAQERDQLYAQMNNTERRQANSR